MALKAANLLLDQKHSVCFSQFFRIAADFFRLQDSFVSENEAVAKIHPACKTGFKIAWLNSEYD